MPSRSVQFAVEVVEQAPNWESLSFSLTSAWRLSMTDDKYLQEILKAAKQ